MVRTTITIRDCPHKFGLSLVTAKQKLKSDSHVITLAVARLWGFSVRRNEGVCANNVEQPSPSLVSLLVR